MTNVTCMIKAYTFTQVYRMAASKMTLRKKRD
jgi:hypothetical protein